MAVTNGYCSTDDVRKQLGDDDTRLDQALLDRAVNAASRAVDRHCHRRFWQDTEAQQRLYRADDDQMVWTDDISTVEGLVVETDDTGRGVFAATWDRDVDYQLEPLNADADGPTPGAWWQLSAVGTRMWPVYDRRVGVRVTARFGWAAVPDEVVEATLLKATALFRRKDAPFGVAGFGEMGVVRITRSDVDVLELLAHYVKDRPRTLSYRPQRYSLFHSRLTGG